MEEALVAVGGTGQVVLHFYTELFLLGLIPKPFHAVVIDSDELMPSLQDFREFFDAARSGLPPDRVPTVEYLKVEAAGGGTNVRFALTGIGQRQAFHVAEAFFDQETLAQRVQEGLYARPALSAVMASDLDFGDVQLTDARKVLVTGSIIGGTGGGLIAPLLASLPDQFAAGANPSIRAVLFGEFFRPDSDSMPDAVVRFSSNKQMAAQLIREIAPAELHYFSFVDPPPGERVRRDPGVERQAVNLPFPPPEHPYWHALCGSRKLLNEANRPAAVALENAEIEINGQELDHRQVVQQIQRRTSMAAAFSVERVLQNLSRDPWLDRIWGDDLCEKVRTLYSLGRRGQAAVISSPSKFARLVGRELTTRWDTLARRLPIIEEVAIRPFDIADNGWGPGIGSVDPRFTASVAEFSDVAAASILFRCLRGGLA